MYFEESVMSQCWQLFVAKAFLCPGQVSLTVALHTQLSSWLDSFEPQSANNVFHLSETSFSSLQAFLHRESLQDLCSSLSLSLWDYAKPLMKFDSVLSASLSRQLIIRWKKLCGECVRWPFVRRRDGLSPFLHCWPQTNIPCSKTILISSRTYVVTSRTGSLTIFFSVNLLSLHVCIFFGFGRAFVAGGRCWFLTG